MPVANIVQLRKEALQSWEEQYLRDLQKTVKQEKEAVLGSLNLTQVLLTIVGSIIIGGAIGVLFL